MSAGVANQNGPYVSHFQQKNACQQDKERGKSHIKPLRYFPFLKLFVLLLPTTGLRNQWIFSKELIFFTQLPFFRKYEGSSSGVFKEIVVMELYNRSIYQLF